MANSTLRFLFNSFTKNTLGVIFFLAMVFLFSGCHKEDPHGYRFAMQDFIVMAGTEVAYQQAIAKEMAALHNNMAIQNLGLARSVQFDSYVKELSALALNENLSLSIKLNEEVKTQLSYLHGLQASSYQDTLIQMAMEADQSIMSLHIKAGSNSGLNNASLRDWAKQWEVKFRANLQAVQKLR